MLVCVKKEYDRMKSLFKDVDEKKTELIDELLKKAAFLKVQLDDLEKEINEYGAVIHFSDGTSKQSPAYKSFLASIGTYQAIIKTLNQIMGSDVIDEDDEFDDFMKKVNGGN